MATVQVLIGTRWVEMSAPKTVADAAKLAGEHGVAGGTFGFKADGRLVTSGKVPDCDRLEVVEITPEAVEPDDG